MTPIPWLPFSGRRVSVNVLLVGNYPPDRQESMQRYAHALHDGLTRTGHGVRLALPRARLDANGRGAVGAWKWLGYVDKLVLAPREISHAARWADVVHVCDHSNATYVPVNADRPWLVTCHDLLAARGALGEATDCPASPLGRRLQARILAGLARARRVVPVSTATRLDLERLVPAARATSVVPPPLNHPFRVLPAAIVDARLAVLPKLLARPYVLMVGSNLRRKNRERAVDVLARLAPRWDGAMVFAGEPLAPTLRARAATLGIADRIVDVPRPDGDLLEALYNRATCLLFPSRFEGFGWPIVEAQACGCPVVASDVPPHPEVSGGAARLCPVDDADAYAAAIHGLVDDDAERAECVRGGLENVARFSLDRTVERFLELYRAAA